MYEKDDPVTKRNPQQNPQPSHTIHTVLSEIQYQNFNDFTFSQDILVDITNSLFPNPDEFFITNAITQTPHSTQSLSFSNPSFIAHCKTIENFFLPPDTFLMIAILHKAQKDDPVLSTANSCLKQKQKPYL